MEKLFGFILFVAVGVALYNVAMQLYQGAEIKNIFTFDYNYKGPLSLRTSQNPRVEVQGEGTNISGGSSWLLTQPSQSKVTISSGPIPPQGFTSEDLSPFYKRVRISSLSVAYSMDQSSSFMLRVDSGVRDVLNVTGWYLKTNLGNTVSIPRALPTYNPWGGTEQDIVLTGGHSLFVTTLSSSLGPNMRLNKCMGYLNQIFSVTPAFPGICPGINRQEIIGFTGACQSYIVSLGSCDIPSDRDINNVASNDSACRVFLNRRTYGACYQEYSRDTDFLLNEWRVWLGTRMPFDSQHDRLLLFDKNGKVVDEYIY